MLLESMLLMGTNSDRRPKAKFGVPGRFLWRNNTSKPASSVVQDMLSVWRWWFATAVWAQSAS